MVTFEYLNLMCLNTGVPSPNCASSLPVHPSPALLDLVPDAGEDADKAVQRMPFAFDLMKVLSKCQQAELLFSMFTQDEPYCECGIRGKGSSQGAGGQLQLPPEESPNKVLLAHFLQRMEEAHDRELHLQDEECVLLRELILQRPRDQDTGPPPLRDPAPTPPADDLKLEPGSPAKAAVASPARWRCFIRSVRDTHLILCFVPCSMEDLCALVHTPGSMPQDEVSVGLNGTEARTQNEQSGTTGEEAQQETPDENIDVLESSSTFTLSTSDAVDAPHGVAESLMDALSTGGTPYTVDTNLLTDGNPVQPSGKSEGIEQTIETHGTAHMDPDRNNISPGITLTSPEAEASKGKDTASGSFSLAIPVYVYNCPLSGLTDQLVNRWSFQRPQDIHQDMTTKPDMCCGDLRTSLTEDCTGQDRHRMDSETIRDRIRQSAEERTDAGPTGGTEFRHHLSLINEHYHRSFVIGVYTTLLAGQTMHCEDVDTVINGICEESLPIEMNITRYLHNTCGHIRRLVERAKIEQMMREDTAKMIPNTVHAKDEECPESEGDMLEAGVKQPSPLSPIVLLPGSPRRALDGYNYADRTPVHLPLALLNADGTCDETAPCLHSLIQRKFSQIISQYFRPVPAHREFFFYCPLDSKSKSSTSNLDTTGGAFNTSATSDSREPEAEIYREDVFASDGEEDVGGPDADSECDLDSLGSETDHESNLSDLHHPASARRIPPLFIHLICSVRTKGRTLRSMAICNLPTCLGDLKSCLNDVTGSIDLNDLQVTIDVICLTLPTEQEFTESMERPPLNRMASYGSQASHFSGCAMTYEREDMLSVSGKLTKEVYDSLRCLSPEQLQAVNACKDEIMWLLRDEIASALRQTVPVTSETLEMVAHHVSSSENKSCCITRMVPLQFVYGPEQSLTNFIQSFERIELAGYLLNKETNYYYLLLDHARANNLAHAKAVSSALHDLYADSKTFKETTTAFIQSGTGSVVQSVGSSQSSTASTQPSTTSTQPSTLTQPSTASVQSSTASAKLRAAPTQPSTAPAQLTTVSSQANTAISTRENMASTTSTSTQRNTEAAQPGAAFTKPSLTPVDSRPASPQCSVASPQPSADPAPLCIESSQPTAAPPPHAIESTNIGVMSRQDATEPTQPEVESVVPNTDSTNSLTHLEVKESTGMSFREMPTTLDESELGEADGNWPRMVGYVDMGELRGDTLDAGRIRCLDMGGTIQDASIVKAAGLDGSIGADGQHAVVNPPHVEHSEGNDQSKTIISGERCVVNDELHMSVEPETGRGTAKVDKLSRFTVQEVPACGSGEDIKISVIRPSPVKEARGASNSPSVAGLGDSEFGRETDNADGSFTNPPDTSTPKTASELSLTRALQFAGIDSQPSSPSGEPTHPHPVSTFMGDRPPTKRIGSGTNLDKLRSAILVANTSGGQTPNRSHHQSGLQTPLSGSLFDATSQGSIEEEGYDAGSSDSDEEGIMMSCSESMLRYRQLPDFWLIMEIKQDRVDVYFHTRDTGEKTTLCIDQQQLLDHVITTIAMKCRSVNQLLLLQDLFKTRQCNRLLVREADEDVQWPREDKTASISTKHKPHVSEADSDDSDSEAAHQGRYLEAVLRVLPGYFACDCVWRKEFVLHPRLKTDPRRMGATRGVHVLKLVLETFAVANRKNMFVIKEANTGAVFYLRLEQSKSPRHPSGQSTTGDSSPGTRVEEDPLSVAVSRSSSMLSLPHKLKAFDADDDAKTLTPRCSTTDPLQQKSRLDGTTVEEDALQSAQGLPPMESVSEGSIILSAYGIGNVGPDISQELVNVLQKRLDNDILHMLVALFARNPMFKLMPEDVKFIQPENSVAKQVVRLTIPPAAMLHQPALSYYLHQNLLQFLHTPKYADSGPETVFRDYTLPNAPPIPENQVFLCSTKPQHAGGKEKHTTPSTRTRLHDKKKDDDAATTGPAHPGQRQSRSRGRVRLHSPRRHAPTTHVDPAPLEEEQAEESTELTPFQLHPLRRHSASSSLDETEFGDPIGISCIHQTFVDGRGSPIQLLGSPKPSSNAYKDKLDPSMFESMVNNQVYVPSPGNKGPGGASYLLFSSYQLSIRGKVTSLEHGSSFNCTEGPTALVQFSIWERGEMDSHLAERLIRAMKHAICDIVIEYRLLTAPLCDVPAHYRSGMDSPMHSAPQSPVTHFISSAEQRSFSGTPGEGSKKPCEGGRTPKEKNVFNIQSLFKSKSASKDSPKGSPGLAQTSNSADGQHLREKVELRQKIQKYEVGEHGSLQPVYSSTMVDWFEFCTKLGVAGVQSLQLSLTSRFPLEYVLRETQNVLTTLAGDVTCRVFRLTECSSSSHRVNHPPIYLPYSTARTHPGQEPKSESWLELPACSQAHVPGKAAEYLLVGRNVQQWRASIDYQDVDDEAATEHAHPRVQKTSQRFLPQEFTPSGTAKAELGLSGTGQPHGEPWFVPRQRLMLAIIKDKQMTMYTYNWAQTLQGSLDSQITKMVAWHNARSLLLTSILSQKAGLFNLPTTYEHNNMYLCGSDLQPLVKYTNPPPTATHGRPRAVSTGQRGAIHGEASLLQDTFRDQRPATRMHKSTYASLRDPLHRHGAQMIELKRANKKDEEKNGILMHLYENWQQRMGPSHSPINETDLELLRTSSRLIHSVASPLLLSPHWRQKVLPKSARSRHDSRASDTAKSRSRHSSGASIRSKRSDSMDSKKRVDSPDIGAPGHRPAVEEVWHVDLRSSFVSQYIQYLQSLGFVQVRTRSASPKRGSRNLSGDVPPAKAGTGDPRLVIKPHYTYLQKTLPGGIMLLEVGFKEVFFCIYVYAFECSRLPIRSINPQLAVIFTDECEKFKDLTHVHSFAHDFHLRTVQSYIMGRHPVLGQNYHLSGFLHDMIQYYPYAPSFSRNYVLSGMCNLPLATNNASTQLFRYMLDHDKLYGMRAIRMVPLADEDQEMENEYALVQQFSQLAKDYDPTVGGGLVAGGPTDYDVGLVVTHDTQGPRLADFDRPTLRLKYYVLITSRKELFPKQTLEKRLGMFKSTAACHYPAGGSVVEAPADRDDDLPEAGVCDIAGADQQEDTEAALPRPLVHYVAARQDTTNYLGYTNKHQATVVNMLLKQAEYARETIQSIVGSAMSQCRRDLLWQRMLLPGNVTEEEGRRKRRSEHDEGKEPYLTRLSFSEFQELLSIVTRIQLRAIDERLTTLENMNTTWYLNLVRVLRLQYGPNHQCGVSHRYFSSSDGHVQYVVVLNPNFLDTFMMLGVDSISNKTELCAVYRERVPDQTHTPNNPNIQAFAVQTLMEGFVNTCFYHMWAGLL